MSWKQDFEIAVKEYFGIPLDIEIHIDEDCYYSEGCLTCGGTYEFTVTAFYFGEKTAKKPNGYYSHTYNGSLLDFINSL